MGLIDGGRLFDAPGDAVWNRPDLSGPAPRNDKGEHAMNIKTGVHIGYPGGSYTQSCENISYDPATRILKADCEAENYFTYPTSIEVPTNYDDIVNCNGYLSINYCTGWEG